MDTNKVTELAKQIAIQSGFKKFYATKDGNIFRANDKGEPSNACLNHQRVCKGDLLSIEFTDEDLKKQDTSAAATNGPVVYSELTNEKLLALLTERGIDKGKAKSKPDYVALLEAADKAAV